MKTLNQPVITLCTLFDIRFAIQGITMIESVERHTSASINWVTLALDNETYDYLTKLQKENLKILRFEDLGDQELLNLFGVRPWNEICWTSAACLLSYCLKNSKADELVAYIDADCFFFQDFLEFLDNTEPQKRIFIHGHRFSEDRAEWLNKSGRFNVGVVAGFKSDEFDQCVNRWRAQVIEDCSVNQELGKCGDQSYLNEWPNLYHSLKIVDFKGAGVAPWNLNNYRLGLRETGPTVDGENIIFFHFHGLKFVHIGKWIWLYFIAPGYSLREDPDKFIYKKYSKELSGHYDLYESAAQRCTSFSSTIKNMRKYKLHLLCPKWRMF
jgi:hypothetical protein